MYTGKMQPSGAETCRDSSLRSSPRPYFGQCGPRSIAIVTHRTATCTQEFDSTIERSWDRHLSQQSKSSVSVAGPYLRSRVAAFGPLISPVTNARPRTTLTRVAHPYNPEKSTSSL